MTQCQTSQIINVFEQCMRHIEPQQDYNQICGDKGNKNFSVTSQQKTKEHMTTGNKIKAMKLFWK